VTFRFTGYPDRYKPAFVRMVRFAGKSRTNSREVLTSHCFYLLQYNNSFVVRMPFMRMKPKSR